MRIVGIRLKDDDTPFLNMLFVIEDKDRFVCTNLDGKILVYPKSEYTFIFLDPSEESSNLESNVTHLCFAYNAQDKKIDELIQRVKKLEADAKCFNKAFISAGITEYPAIVQESTFTKEKALLAFERWCVSIGLPGMVEQVGKFNSELDKVKDGK